MKHDNILHPVYPFPYIMTDKAGIRQMTIHTFYISVKPCHKPRFILGIHNMTGITELGRGCFIHESRRPPHYENGNNK
jgi:hypothetical protein